MSSTGPATILQFRQDLEAQLRKEICEALEVALREELASTLASEHHERTDQPRGYRNGLVGRTITITDGTRTVKVPRGGMVGRDGRRTNSTAAAAALRTGGPARSTKRSSAAISAA